MEKFQPKSLDWVPPPGPLVTNGVAFFVCPLVSHFWKWKNFHDRRKSGIEFRWARSKKKRRKKSVRWEGRQLLVRIKLTPSLPIENTLAGGYPLLTVIREFICPVDMPLDGHPEESQWMRLAASIGETVVSISSLESSALVMMTLPVDSLANITVGLFQAE